MSCTPSGAILVHHLVGIGNPLYLEGSLPSWSQLVGTLWRSGEHKDEAPLLIWVCDGRSWWWGHLLVGQGERLPEHLNVCGGVIEGWGSTGIAIEIQREGGLSSSGNHRCREAMGLMDHRVQSQHDARNLLYPCLGGRTIKQASSEHIINGPMAALVDGVALRMVGGG